METWILAGDVGGTKTALGLYRCRAGARPEEKRSQRFPSRDYEGLASVIDEFLDGEKLAAAAFGIAGPVEAGVVDVTNLPWRIEEQALPARLGCPVRLLNDLEATAYAALEISADECEVLQQGEPREGNRCVIAAGTGLGQALLLWDGSRHRPCPTEGGHASFAPRDETEIELLRFLLRRHPRVSWERVLSGSGLADIYDFVVEVERVRSSVDVTAGSTEGDRAPAIGAAGIAGACPAAARTVALFASIYGGQAGNLALTSMAIGGVYVAGGMAAKLLPALRADDAFREAFVAKEPFEDLLRRVPLRVVLDVDAARRGAASVAQRIVG